MVNPQHATGRAESPIPDPTGQSDGPTLHEFLTRLVSDPAARSAFDADPQATLDQAGLGGMTATDVLQATSLVLDYAPVEVVTEYDRSLQSSVEKFAASTQHVAINQLHPAHPFEQEEQSMLQNTPAQPADFSGSNDVDATMPAPAPAPATGGDVNVDIEQTDSHNLISIHDNNIATDNIVGSIVGNTIGQVGDNVDLGDVTSVARLAITETNYTANQIWDDSLDVTVGAGEIVYGDVTDVVGNVTSGDALNIVNEAPLVGDLNVTGVLGDVTGGDVTSIVTDAPLVGDVIGGDVTSIATDAPIVGDVVGGVVGGDVTNVVGNVTGVAGDLPIVGEVTGVVGDVAGDVPVVGDVVGGVAGGDVSALPVEDATSALPVGDVVSHLPAPSDLPLAGPVVGETVENVAGTATSALPLDGLL
jgi:hypothetical protein